MRKFISILLLAFVSSNAMAELVKVGESNSLIEYAYPDTIRRSDHEVKIWLLLDYKAQQPTVGRKPFLSEKMQDEYDCNEEQSRGLAITVYSGNMGSGNVIFSDAYLSDWKPVTPDSLDETTLKYACGNK